MSTFSTFITPIKTIAFIIGSLIPTALSGSIAVAQSAPAVHEIEIVVDGGYKPSNITIRTGERVRLKFVRKEYSGCTREVVIPALELRKELPPNKPVFVDLPALSPGQYEFRCGMNMVRGSITVVAG
jgi:plastocyanin domain-containing protein